MNNNEDNVLVMDNFLEVNKDDEEVLENKNEIYKIETYQDEEGRMVIHKVSIDSGKTINQGVFPVNTNMGPIKLDFEFPEGLNLEECFAVFDDHAEKKVQEIQGEMQEQSRIMTPDQFRKP